MRPVKKPPVDATATPSTQLLNQPHQPWKKVIRYKSKNWQGAF